MFLPLAYEIYMGFIVNTIIKNFPQFISDCVGHSDWCGPRPLLGVVGDAQTVAVSHRSMECMAHPH